MGASIRQKSFEVLTAHHVDGTTIDDLIMRCETVSADCVTERGRARIPGQFRRLFEGEIISHAYS